MVRDSQLSMGGDLYGLQRATDLDDVRGKLVRLVAS